MKHNILSNSKPEAYEGKEPYIFISYAHKDSDKVFPILNSLVEKGYRIWYDDGIEAGSEWPEYIATHLNDSQIMIAMISNNSITSDNCRREITYGLSQKKNFIGVFLEETKMSPGMEMQLSAQQCLFYYKHKSMDDFIQTLEKNSLIQACRVEKEIYEESKQQEKKNLESSKDSEKKQHDKKIIKKGVKLKNNKKIIFSVAVIIAVLVVGVGVITFNKMYSNVKITDTLEVKRNSTNVTLEDTKINADLIENLSLLKKLNSLNIKNCTFDSSLTDGSSDSNNQLAEFFSENDLRYLYITDTDLSGVDTGFLKYCVNCYSVDLTNCSLTDGAIAPLYEVSEFNIKDLDISNNSSLTTLPSSASELTKLNISGTGISDISSLSTYENLHFFEANKTPISDLTPLEGLTNMQEISANNCQISEISGTFNCLSLEKLYLGGNNLTDISAFDNMTILKEVNISGNSITSAPCLMKSTATLEKLNISGNQLDIDTLSGIAQASNITDLRMSDIHTASEYVQNLIIVQNMSQLADLTAKNCQITNIDSLAGKPIEWLDLSNNQITSIDALGELSNAESYLKFNLSNNQLTDVSSLPKRKYSSLLLYGNLNLDPTTLDTSGEVIYRLAIDYSENLVNCPVITNRNLTYTVVVLNCPADKILSLQDLIGESNLYLATKDNLSDILKEAEISTKQDKDDLISTYN